jgi:plasmid replication initiation protein
MNDVEKQQQLAVATGVTDGSKKDAALKLALEHIEGNFTVSADQAIAAIKEALEDA